MLTTVLSASPSSKIVFSLCFCSIYKWLFSFSARKTHSLLIRKSVSTFSGLFLLRGSSKFGQIRPMSDYGDTYH